MYGTHFRGAPEKGCLLSDLEVGEEKKQVSRTHGIIKGTKKKKTVPSYDPYFSEFIKEISLSRAELEPFLALHVEG